MQMIIGSVIGWVITMYFIACVYAYYKELQAEEGGQVGKA